MAIYSTVYERAAKLIREHGAEAPMYAEIMADHMLAAGNVYERRTWRRVVEAVDELLSRNPPPGSPIH